MSTEMNMWLIVVSVVSICLGAIAALLWGRKLLQNYLASIYKVTDIQGIEKLDSVMIGGVRQWLHIRGRSRDNPILLFLHGGPCWTHIGWHDAIQRPWEDYYTVIQWDQRLAGKSYHSLKKYGHTLSCQQLIRDAEQMMKYLRSQFGDKKIFLMGTSLGSYIGMHLVKSHPEWFYAYVGVGQIMTMTKHARDEHRFLLEYAVQNELQTLESDLKAIGNYPNPDNPLQSLCDHGGFLIDQSCRIGKAYPDNMQALFTMAAIGKWISPLYSLRDNLNRKYGNDGSQCSRDMPVISELMSINLPEEIGADFEIPIFFFSGSEDFHISHKTTDSWFEEIRAPYKEQVLFKHSAHVPYQTEPGQFLFALVDKVLPMRVED